MRLVICIVLALIFAATAVAAPVPPTQADQAAAPAAFRIYVRGVQVGTEQVSVIRSADGTVISGSGRLAPPLDVITNRCEIRYDAQWRPVEVSFDALVRGTYTSLHTVFNNDTAATQVVQGGAQPANKTDKVSPNAVVLLNTFFGGYEGLAARLLPLKAGDELPAYVVPSTQITIQVKDVADERIQAPGRTIVNKHFTLQFNNPGVPAMGDMWVDESGRVLRLAIPAQSFEMVREDIASVAARREVAHREGDEQVRIPANGFTLAGTLSKPAAAVAAAKGAKAGKTARYPAVVLVGGSGPTDRDEVAFNIPIFAQVAGALADAGFIVVRYDKRGVGQSGGRADAATLEQYADDARAAVAFLRDRKDVDRKRIALVGHSEGGWTALLAAQKNKDIAAVALIATPGVTGADLVLAQQQHMLQAMKITPAERQAKIDLQKKVQKAVLSGTGWDGVPADVQRQADTPWFRSFLGFDPARVMPNVKQPLLIVQGDLDQQVFAAQADRLGQLAKARKAPADKQVTVVHVPGVNHLLVAATTGEYDEYPKLTDRNVSKDVLSALTSWLGKELAPRP